MEPRTSVLVVGGGLNGLTAAALLAHHEVPCVVVERHPDTSIQYKFAGISPRSMEIFRSLGLEDEIRSSRTGDQQAGGIARGRNLADPDIQWGGAAWPDASGVSPTQPATCDQHVLEPILRNFAAGRGADVRFNTELADLEQDARGVSARLLDRGTGKIVTLLADYAIVADGANGRLRERLGIGRRGAGALQHWMNIVFDTDLPPTLDGRRFTSCFVTNLNGTFTPRDGGRWLLALQYFPEKGQRPAMFDERYCRELVARGAGRADVRAKLVDARPWEVASYVADRFRAGRCFLAGDCAHVMPPTGAFGGNSGIHDVHNLVWKLALVLRGQAQPDLLDSYDDERRPVIEATAAQALARLQKWFKDPAGRLPPPAEIVADYDVVFGQRYPVAAENDEPRTSDGTFEPADGLSARVGTRAPHMWIEHSGKKVSTLDLFDREFVLLADDENWKRAAEPARRGLAAPLSCHFFGPHGDLRDIERHWPSAYGISDGGAVLVRPDGFIAWRSPRGEHGDEQKLSAVFERLGLRPTGQGLRPAG